MRPLRVAMRAVAVAAALSLITPMRTSAQPRAIPLDSATRFDVHNGRLVWGTYRGRDAVQLAPRAGHERDQDEEISATLLDTDFKDGVIEVDVAGARREGYATDNASAFKGFIGISFRVRGDSAERFYIRAENGRIEEQLFRNRTTQYEASPEWTWQRLRQEAPGKYESYADVEAGAWTSLRIEVSGTRARLFVNGAPHPALVVNDLKFGAGGGRIALWTRVSADAYFSNLRVTSAQPAARIIPPDAARFSIVLNGRTRVTDYRGRRAVQLIAGAETAGKDEDMLAVLDDADFRDGTVEVDVAGAPRPGMPPDSRGFIGIAFRTGVRGAWSEVFYLRPTNGRADDQLRRNHAVQYVAHPEHTWDRLRAESPGVYESYADLEPAAWTSLRIVVAGTTARLYVNGAAQPALIVKDLKRGAQAGSIALWAHVETDAYFGTLSITPAK